jgi:hypothetical protein
MNAVIILLLAIFSSPALAQLGQSSVGRLDEIRSNQTSNVRLNPSGDVVLEPGTAGRALFLDGQKNIKSSATTSTELGHLSGVTSSVQTQINSKANASDTVNLTGDQSISDTKTFTGKVVTLSTANGSIPCPVMTLAQRNALTGQATGDCVYNSTDLILNIWNGTEWTSAGGSGISPWLTAKDYKINDVVVESRRIYQALTNHTSGVFATDLAANRWQLISDELSVKANSGSAFSVRELGAPAWQLTQTASGAGRIETGSSNLLRNPGFEHQAASTGWTCTTTGTATCEMTAETNPLLKLDGGNRSLQVECFGGASGGTCSFFQDVTTSHSLQGLVSAYLRTEHPDVSVHSRVDGVRSGVCTSTSVSGICAMVRIELKLNQYSLPQVTGTTSTGIEVFMQPGASQVRRIYADDAFVGYQSVVQTSPTVTAWQSYTPTFTGFGTVTIDYCRSRQNGTNREIDCKFTAGTPTGVEARISLPSGDTSSSGWTNTKASGYWFKGAAATSHGGSILIEPSVTYLTMSDAGVFGNNSTNALSKSVGTSILSAGEVVSLFASVPVANLSGSTSTISSTNADTDWRSCGHTGSSFNGFGTATNITTECKRQGSDLLMRGRFQAGVRTANPARIALPVWNGQQLMTKPGIQREIAGTSFWSGTTIAGPYSIIMDPTSQSYVSWGFQNAPSGPYNYANGNELGADNTTYGLSNNVRIPIAGWENSNVIVASLNETVTTPGVTRPVGFSFGFSGSAAWNSTCSANPCTLRNNKGGIVTGVTRTGTGLYTVSLSGLTGSPPNCGTWTVNWSTGALAFCYPLTEPTLTTIGLACVNSAGTAVDASMRFVCDGERSP